MDRCLECGEPIAENGTAMCGKGSADACDRDVTKFNENVEAAKHALQIHILDAISKNQMPACFEVTRPAYVAMAALLMQALHQNEEMARTLRDMGFGSAVKTEH